LIHQSSTSTDISEQITSSPYPSEPAASRRGRILKKLEIPDDSAVFNDVATRHRHQQKGISSERQNTTRTSQTQAPNPAPTRQDAAARNRSADVAGQQHPV
jgi:hypothetical protein